MRINDSRQPTFSCKQFASLSKSISLSLLVFLLYACGGGSNGNTPQIQNETLPSGGSPIAEIEDNTNATDPLTGLNSNDDDLETSYASYSITLIWSEPNLYDNGQAFSRSEIESYEVKWGLSQTALTTLAVIDGPNTLEYTIEDLNQGIYYFSVSIKTIYGNDSNPSNILKKVIN